MKTTFIAKEGNDAKFTMVFTGEEFENAVVNAYKNNKDRFEIKGFRKGKAPRKMIENTYGEDIFYDEALNDLLQSGYPAALNELELVVIDQPKLNLGELKKGEDVEITATVACFPEVEAKDYFGLEVEKIEHEVTDEDIQKELEGDTVVLDFDGSVDGVHFDGGKAENFDLKLGSGQFIPGFEDQLVGKEAGEEVDVHVTFPEGYQAEDLAGKEALFECKINEIKREGLPEINDELASDVSEFETLEEYKNSIRERMQKEDDERADSIMKDSMVQKLIDVNSVDTPASMVESEIDTMIQGMKQQLAYQGLSLEQYQKFTGMDMAAMRDQARMDAEKRDASRILLKAVIRQENIEATEEDIDKEMADFAAQYGQSVEDVKKMIGNDLHYFEEDVKMKKAIDMMFEKANFVAAKAKEEE